MSVSTPAIVNAEHLLASVIAQLRAEFAASSRSVKDVAGELGVSYGAYRRYIVGERVLSLVLLLSTVDVLGLDLATFMNRASERLSAG